jgi:hypothetical protein
MGSSLGQNSLPDSKSPDLHLSHPTPNECVKISTNNSDSWRDSLTRPVFLQESLFLATVPLAKDGGMTTWILVEKNLPQDHRPIFCSCETFLKRSLMSDADGKIEEVIVHGIASVFCPLGYRRRGYAARHMTEVAKALRTWQSDQGKVAGSVLYSDIGKTYYAKLGWQPNPTNWHVEFPPMNIPKSPLTQELVEDDLAELCKRDEAIIRAAMATPADGSLARYRGPRERLLGRQEARYGQFGRIVTTGTQWQSHPVMSCTFYDLSLKVMTVQIKLHPPGKKVCEKVRKKSKYAL